MINNLLLFLQEENAELASKSANEQVGVYLAMAMAAGFMVGICSFIFLSWIHRERKEH